jgi:hypothetical protein
MALGTVKGLLAEMLEGVRVVLSTIRHTSLVVRILLVAASLCWLGIGGGLTLIGGPTLFLPLIIWAIFTILILSFIGDVFGTQRTSQQ